MEEPHQAGQGGELEHMAQGRAALFPGGPEGGAFPGAAAPLQAEVGLQEPQHGGNRQQIAECIECQGDRHARQGHQPSTDGRAHQLADVEDHREAGQIGSELLRSLHQQRAVLVAGGQFVAAGHSHQQRAQQQRHHQGGRPAGQQRDRHRSHSAGGQQTPLGPDQNRLTAESVGEHPGRATEHQAGQCQGGEMEREQQGAAVVLQQEPALGSETGEGSSGAESGSQQEEAALMAEPPAVPAERGCRFWSDQASRRPTARTAPTSSRAPTTMPRRS